MKQIFCQFLRTVDVKKRPPVLVSKGNKLHALASKTMIEAARTLTERLLAFKHCAEQVACFQSRQGWRAVTDK